MAKGKKTGGRQKGSPNKVTASIKAAIAQCFDDIGGQAAFAAWAQEHQSEFYTKVMPRIVPVEVAGGTGDVEPLRIEVTRRAPASHAG
jgi:hypothetical protein